jgi:hypothetical protein
MSRLWDESVLMLLLDRGGKNAVITRKFKKRKFHLLVLLQENFVHVTVLAKSLLEAAHKHIHLVKLHT